MNNEEIKKEREKLAKMVDDVLEKSSYAPSPMQKVPLNLYHQVNTYVEAILKYGIFYTEIQLQVLFF